ncbi:MAG: nuclear transport factor 2 family protein [Rhodoferax sp.]|nr:nuclear transport factor 2 family protein [Rhodoferax sp.]
MPKARKSSAQVGGSADETESTFYEAMQTGDIERLMSCWADEDEVICIHPGGPRLVGLGAVRAAFESVFNNGNVRVQIEALRKIESMTSAVHSVRERIELLTNEGPVEAFAIATNVYHKTAQGWRMVAHHVSPGSLREAPDISEVPHVLH